MRVAVDELVPVPEPRMKVQHEQILAMFLGSGSMLIGRRYGGSLLPVGG